MTAQLTHPLHLYRALLRESTYLFDRNAQDWTRRYIRSSFRRHAPKIIHGSTSKLISYNPDETPSILQRNLLKRGRKFLYLLSRANLGHQRHLRNLLKLTYGRKGRRKRTLTAPLLQSSTKLEDSQVQTRIVKKFSRQWKAPDNLTALLSAQDQISDHLDVRRKIKLHPPIDGKNKWGKPMPLSRVKNISKKWYAQMASVVMPPVPKKEWEAIQAKALNKEHFVIIPRRPVASQPVFNKEEEDDEKIQTAADVIIAGFDSTNSHKFNRSIGNPHRLTQRYLSRFYGRHILNHTPLVEPDPKGSGLVSKWDDGKRNILLVERPKNDAQTEALFG